MVLCSQGRPRSSGNCLIPQPSASWRPHYPQTPALGLESRSKASLQGSLAWGCKGTAISGAQQGTIYNHTQRTWEGHCCLLGSNEWYLCAAPPLGSQDTAWKRGTMSAPDTQERLRLCKARGQALPPGFFWEAESAFRQAAGAQGTLWPQKTGGMGVRTRRSIV